MAKPIPKKIVSKPVQESKPLIPEKYQDIFYIVSIVIAVFVFLGSGIFSGTFSSSDVLSSISVRPYIEQATKDGNFPLWIPYIFCGMPSYASLLATGDRVWDIFPLIFFGITRFFGWLLSNDNARVASFYCIYGIGMYLLMRTKQKERFVAFFTAFAATFSTSVIIWIMIGHNTKPVVFAMFPFIFMFMEKLRERFSLVYAVLLVFAIHIMMEAGHIQMMFYGACAFGLYLLFEFISRLISKQEPMKILRVAIIALAAAGLSFLMSSDRYLTTMEYTQYSTRGSAPIHKTDKQTQDATGGNDYEYATMWSFSPGEIMTFFVPNFYGFGKLEYKGELTGNREVRLPTYWGQKPFEDAAAYMGIAVLGLALFGAFHFRKDVFVQFLIALSLFALLLSFGYTLPVLYDFFFYNVPSFNKFRAPSMALAMMQFAVPVLAGYGLAGIFKFRKDADEKDKKTVMYMLIAAGAFFVIGLAFSAIFQSAYLDSMDESDLIKRFSSQYGASAADSIKEFVWGEMISDWLINGALLVAAALGAWLFINRKISRSLFIPLIALILIFDLWRVGWRPMEVQKQAAEKAAFVQTDVVQFLKQDKSMFRIADFTSESPNKPAYFMLQSVNGYHAAKLRVFQDMLDVADNGSTSQVTNPFLWNLMNVKYIISPQQLQGTEPIFQSASGNGFVYYNASMLPRVLFVDTAKQADQMDILNSLKQGSFDPSQVAYVEESLPVTLDSAGETAKARVVDYRNEYIKIEAEATGNNLLLISEIYYPPGWTAYIDGTETKIYKTNFAFRSIIVPKGKHTIEMKFSSERFEMGRTLSILANILTFGALGVGIFLESRNRKKKEEVGTN